MRIVLTRPAGDNASFAQKLRALGVRVYEFPAITIAERPLDQKSKKILRAFSSYQWIIFTSARSIQFFLHHLKEAGIGIGDLKRKKIAAVGPATAARLKAYGMTVSAMPEEYLTERIPYVLGAIRGAHILLPAADIASRRLPSALRKKGAHVTRMPIYRTAYATERDLVFEKLVADGKITYCTLTSPSCARGFLGRIANSDVRKKALRIPVISIGPVTTKTARALGFRTISTAPTHTIDGMIEILNALHA